MDDKYLKKLQEMYEKYSGVRNSNCCGEDGFVFYGGGDNYSDSDSYSDSYSDNW